MVRNTIQFSADAYAGVERRGVTRTRVDLAWGKLGVSGFEQICRVRDVSPRGIGVGARWLPLPGQRVSVGMRGLAPSLAVVVWRDLGRCGLAFRVEQDLRHVPAAPSGRRPKQPRASRFSLRLPAELRWEQGVVELELADISTGGLKLNGGPAPRVGERGVVRLEGLSHLVPGRIRWKRGGMTGFHFDRPLSRDDLFSLLCCRG